MMPFLSDRLEFWHWLIAAVILGMIEIVMPGFFFIWLGLAAAVMGGIAYAAQDLSWQWQLVIFAGLSVISIVMARLYQARHPTRSDDANLNERAARYIGHVYVVEESFTGGRGKIRIGDTLWIAEGPNLVSGARARVTGADGSVLKVEPAE